MSAYLDSSALIKLYVPETHSAEISRYVRTKQQPLPMSHLHDLELRNGLRMKVFRKEASVAAVRGALEMIDSDLSAGVLRRPGMNWFDVFHYAEELSSAHSAKLGCRSLDVLHISSALLIEAEDFVSFDDRQAVLARKAGLNVVDVTVF